MIYFFKSLQTGKTWWRQSDKQREKIFFLERTTLFPGLPAYQDLWLWCSQQQYWQNSPDGNGDWWVPRAFIRHENQKGKGNEIRQIGIRKTPLGFAIPPFSKPKRSADSKRTINQSPQPLWQKLISATDVTWAKITNRYPILHLVLKPRATKLPPRWGCELLKSSSDAGRGLQFNPPILFDLQYRHSPKPRRSANSKEQ